MNLKKKKWQLMVASLLELIPIKNDSHRLSDSLYDSNLVHTHFLLRQFFLRALLSFFVTGMGKKSCYVGQRYLYA